MYGYNSYKLYGSDLNKNLLQPPVWFFLHKNEE